MNKLLHPLLGCLAGFTLTVAAAEDGESLNFRSCPVVRDTTTVPCWLAEHDGELYYLGIQTDISADFHPPYLGHQVIVEGQISPDQPRICGGVVLDPVVISPVAEPDANCNTILPVVDEYQVDFNPRPPGPSTGRLAFQGPPPAPVETQPTDPAEGEEFSLYYYHDGRVEGRNSGVLNRIVRYAQEVDANEIQVTGYSGSVLLSNGDELDERPELGRLRAEEVKKLLVGAGLDAGVIRTEWEPAVPGDGAEDWQNRRTTVRVRRRD